jgi:hypothetical protein
MNSAPSVVVALNEIIETDPSPSSRIERDLARSRGLPYLHSGLHSQDRVRSHSVVPKLTQIEWIMRWNNFFTY